MPQNLEPPLKVLGTGADRFALLAAAMPLEMVVAQGYTREIEDAFQKWRGRPDDFWTEHSHLLENVRKLDEVLAVVQARKK